MGLKKRSPVLSRRRLKKINTMKAWKKAVVVLVKS